MSQKLTSKQLHAAWLLARGSSQTLIARELKVRRETIARWKQLPEFQEEYERMIAAARVGLEQRLAGIFSGCLDTLSDELYDYRQEKRAQFAISTLKLLGIERMLSTPAFLENEVPPKKNPDDIEWSPGSTGEVIETRITPASLPHSLE